MGAVFRAFRQRRRGRAVQPLGMRVALLVGEGVVPAVIGDSVDDRPLQREQAGHRQRGLEAAVAAEGTVGEQLVEPDGYAQTGNDVERRGQSDVGERQSLAPRERRRRGRRGQRQHRKR